MGGVVKVFRPRGVRCPPSSTASAPAAPRLHNASAPCNSSPPCLILYLVVAPLPASVHPCSRSPRVKPQTATATPNPAGGFRIAPARPSDPATLPALAVARSPLVWVSVCMCRAPLGCGAVERGRGCAGVWCAGAPPEGYIYKYILPPSGAARPGSRGVRRAQSVRSPCAVGGRASANCTNRARTRTKYAETNER